MNPATFENLPDEARLYVFAASRPLTDPEAARLIREVDAHLAGWVSHGDPVSGARAVLYSRFLLIAVDESKTPLSGCSIDSLTRHLKGMEAELGVSLVDSGPVSYRAADGIRRVTRAEFQRLVEAGEVTPETTVFDNTVSTVGALRRGRWELPMQDSWHGRAFKSVA